MKFIRLFLVLILTVALAGCGEDGDDKVGNLTLDTPTATNNTNGTYTVSAVATYTHPTQVDLVGVEISFKLIDTLTGITVGSASDSTPTNGKFGVSFIVPQTTSPQGFLFVAKTGDLEDSKSVSVPALGALTVEPGSVTFSNTELSSFVKNVAISGGVAPYSVSSSNTSMVTATVSNNTVTLTRMSDAAAVSIVTITDSASVSTSLTVTLE